MHESASKTSARLRRDLPLLINDRSLDGAGDFVARMAFSESAQGREVSLEEISMPKRAFGSRPIAIFSPIDRCVFSALVESLTDVLPEPSRAGGFKEHSEFGLEDNPNFAQQCRAVDLDVAACYEYIDHQVLGAELIHQGADFELTSALMLMLENLAPRGVGIPQALDESDLLADLYLSKLERALLRSGRPVHRYADDFRVIADTVDEAFELLELAIEEARALGLTLAHHKTSIRSLSEIRTDNEQREAILERYRDVAQDGLRAIDFVRVGYDDVEEVEIEVSSQETDFQAYRMIVDEWVAERTDGRRPYPALGLRALRVLRQAPEPLPPESLIEICRADPSRVKNVMEYAAARMSDSSPGEAASALRVIEGVARLARTSSWTHLWLLHLAEAALDAGADLRSAQGWIQSLLKSRSESVRAQATWLCSRAFPAVQIDLFAQYLRATPVSQCGLAACAGLLDELRGTRQHESIAGDSALARKAYNWGLNHGEV